MVKGNSGKVYAFLPDMGRYCIFSLHFSCQWS